ncbi:MAG: hypothetical protein OJF50_002698 [Nitrospira sp.]|nr:hypothetical protein [Nitrospira sp.]
MEGEDLHSSSSRLDGRVTVVVLTHNRVQEVLRTVGHLVRLPENPTIIVMDNASSDGTSWQIADRYPAVQVLRMNTNMGAAARCFFPRRNPHSNAGAGRYPAPSSKRTDRAAGSPLNDRERRTGSTFMPARSKNPRAEKATVAIPTRHSLSRWPRRPRRDSFRDRERSVWPSLDP